MNNQDWKNFLTIAYNILIAKPEAERVSFDSWCSWTTYGRLTRDSGYWTGELPNISDLAETSTKDGGSFGFMQPFPYNDFAHFIIPAHYTWEHVTPAPENKWSAHEKNQDIEALSHELKKANISHKKTDLVIEIKLF